MPETLTAQELVASVETVAGCVLSVWGVLKILGMILMWIRRRRTSPFRELDSKLENMMEQLRVIEKEARENTEAIATLQLNELSSAFVHYVDHNRPCPMSVKNGLSEMYKQYKSTGRNHVANDYMERLIGLPVDENERRGQT